MKAVRQHLEELRARGELPEWTLTEDGGAWTLLRNGAVAARWHERDAPGIGDCVEYMVETLAIVTTISSASERTIRQQQKGGARGGIKAAGKNAHPYRAVVVRLIRARLAGDEAPEDYAAAWADDYGASLGTVYRWIKKVRNAPT